MCVWDREISLKLADDVGGRKAAGRRISQPRDDVAGAGRLRGQGKDREYLWEVIGSNHGDSHLRAQGRDDESVQKTIWVRTEELKQRHTVPDTEELECMKRKVSLEEKPKVQFRSGCMSM